MDSLLRGETFEFFVDEVYAVPEIKKENNNISKGVSLFGALLIPDIKSTFFPPYHLRRILFPATFLSNNYYNYYRRKYPTLDNISDAEFSGSIVEGQYYSLRTNVFTDYRFPEILPPTFQTLLNQSKLDSPYRDSLTDNINDEGLALLNNAEHGDGEKILLYCFNVGQGDSMLLILPNKSVYIIDTNFYSGRKITGYINKIIRILESNGIHSKKIKGLLITHKHLDHIRGAAQIIDCGDFVFENFIINFDYVHSNKKVEELLDVANRKIANHINVNKQDTFYEGKVKISVLNPKPDTCNKTVCSDLNDSSIVLKLEYGESKVLLSGDAGFPITNSVIKGQANNYLLKVSYHASRTGTDEVLMNKLHPSYAFISAGNHKGFNHPHKEATDLLNKYDVDFDISKEVGSMVYVITEKSIMKNPFKVT
ncbi:ComEC/Rec2 family competence protein [Virgibacillus ainsalahensis]